MATMNTAVVRRMIKRLRAVPESYDQSAFVVEESDEAPCGTVACLAGEAVICSETTITKGIKLAFSGDIDLLERAEEVLGLTGLNHGVFSFNAAGWPKPFNDQFAATDSREAKARVAIAYLTEALKRGTMIWEGHVQ